MHKAYCPIAFATDFIGPFGLEPLKLEIVVLPLPFPKKTSIGFLVFLVNFVHHKFTKNLIIMDNGGAHKKKAIGVNISKNGNLLQYSVPYRPKTNAIESWFNQFKYYLQQDSKYYTYQELKKRVKKIIDEIPKVHYYNYMKYAYKQKDNRKYIKQQSTRRKKLKQYKI